MCWEATTLANAVGDASGRLRVKVIGMTRQLTAICSPLRPNAKMLCGTNRARPVLAKTGFPNLYAKETEMSTTQTVPQGKDTAIAGELYMSFELGDKSWKVTASDGRRAPSRYSVEAGDVAAVARCIGKARERCKLSTGRSPRARRSTRTPGQTKASSWPAASRQGSATRTWRA